MSLSEEPSEQSFALRSLFVFFLIQFLFADLRYFDDRISVEMDIEHVKNPIPNNHYTIIRKSAHRQYSGERSSFFTYNLHAGG